MKPLEILDCFAGIGGFSVAAERLVGGFKTTQFIEIDPYCQKILNKHFKEVPIHDDIRTFSAPEGAYRVLTGGFPCQDVSVAGKQRGIGEGTRSGLFYEILRLSREIRPEFLLLENVRNLLSHEGGKTFQEVLYQIAKTGVFKCIEWGVVSAKDVGASHKLERSSILAHSKYDGQSTPTRIRVNAEADNETSQGKEETCQLEGGIEPRGSETIQRATETEPTNSDSKRSQGLRGEYELQESSREEEACWRTEPHSLQPDWRKYSVEPCLSRGHDGLRNRVDRIRCLGNAVCPQSASVPLQRIQDLRSL